MPKHRVTPHRPPRENAHAKELAEIKQENQQLKREVSRLRKELDKKPVTEPEEPESMGAAQEEQHKPPATICAGCGSKAPPNVITTPSGKVVSICVQCKKRKIIDGPL